MTAIILAGGKSNRFGSDKAFIEIAGTPLIKRHLKLLRGLFSKIIIVTNQPHKYRFKNVKIVQDIVKDSGPLAGIYSGLLSSGSFYNFIMACDMPFINKELIRYMTGHKNNYDVIIPKIGNKFHPLFGVYSKKCIPVIEKMLKNDRLKVSSIFPKVKTHFIPKKTIEKFDENLLSLININTKEGLAKIKKRMPSLLNYFLI